MRRITFFAAAAAIGFAAGFLGHVDYEPGQGTYGLSAGTDSHYCSVAVVHLRPELTCEAAP